MDVKYIIEFTKKIGFCVKVILIFAMMARGVIMVWFGKKLVWFGNLIYDFWSTR